MNGINKNNFRISIYGAFQEVEISNKLIPDFIEYNGNYKSEYFIFEDRVIRRSFLWGEGIGFSHFDLVNTSYTFEKTNKKSCITKLNGIPVVVTAECKYKYMDWNIHYPNAHVILNKYPIESGLYPEVILNKFKQYGIC